MKKSHTSQSTPEPKKQVENNKEGFIEDAELINLLQSYQDSQNPYISAQQDFMNNRLNGVQSMFGQVMPLFIPTQVFSMPLSGDTEEFIEETLDEKGHHTTKHITKGNGYQQIELISDRPIDQSEIGKMIEQVITEMVTSTQSASGTRQVQQLPAILPYADFEKFLQELEDLDYEEEIINAHTSSEPKVTGPLSNQSKIKQNNESETSGSLSIFVTTFGILFIVAIFYLFYRLIKSQQESFNQRQSKENNSTDEFNTVHSILKKPEKKE